MSAGGTSPWFTQSETLHRRPSQEDPEAVAARRRRRVHHAEPIRRSVLGLLEDRRRITRPKLAAAGPIAKIVGAHIALHHNVETGQCNRSLAQLADGTGISDRNVRPMASPGLHRDRFNAPANMLRARGPAVALLPAPLAANSD